MIVPQEAGVSINAGEFRLLTKDGKILKENDTTGLANQQFSKGIIMLIVTDRDSGEAVKEAEV